MIDTAVLGAFLVGALATGIASPFIFRVLVRMKSRQTISQHVPEHAAKQGTPTMGGLMVLVGLIAGTAAFAGEVGLGTWVLIACFTLVGFLDDYVIPRLKPGSRGFGWMPKLILQIGGAALAVFLSLGSDPLLIAIGVFVILFFGNAYNFSDGMDGLAGGLGVIFAFGTAALMYSLGSDLSAAPLGAVAGGLVAFLFWNAPPAKVFMGDVGSMPLGALFGYFVLSILLEPGTTNLQTSAILPVAILSIVMIAEIVPVPLQVASAKLRKGKRLFPFRTPIHHGFQHAGWAETRVVAIFHLVQLICAVGALWLAVNPI